jgi:hypothetical protein
MALGAWLVPDRRFRLVMWTLFALIVGSMAVAAAFDSKVVAALTPWRASVLLMPLSLAVIVARGTTWILARGPQRENRLLIGCTVIALAAVALGISRTAERWSEYADAGSMPPIRWIQDHDERQELYLVPVQDSDFDRFRLETGQPILVNWKTHPYKDVEVLEWHQRLQEAERFYSAGTAHEACKQLARLSERYGVSVVVYAINQTTGEPTHIQSIDGHGTQLRTFAIDPSGRLLVAASIIPLPVRDGDKVTTLSAGLTVCRVGADGKLDFVRKYDVEASAQRQQFWSGMVTLA